MNTRLFFSFSIGLLLFSSPPLSAEDNGGSSQNIPSAKESEEALKVFQEWTKAFQAGDYEAQWYKTHHRIRFWQRKSKWARKMKASVAKTGALISFQITGSTPVTAAQLPCTEQGHCFRRHIQYHLFMVKSEYAGETPPQPEFVVMAKSKEGWRFGGGTFPNRPMGETSVILDKKDEARYRKLP